MKKLLNLLIASLALYGVACTPGGVNETKFSITVSGITHESATVGVSPSTDATYFFDIIEKEIYDATGGGHLFALAMVELIKEAAAEDGLTISDYLSSGPDIYEYSLEPNAEYYAYAFGVTSAGEVTTDITLLPFKTLEKESSNSGDLSNFTYGYYTNWGDYYGSNATNWFIDIYSESTNEMVVLEVQTPLNATTFTGTYQFASTYESGTAVAGSIDASGLLYGSYWALYKGDNSGLLNYALLTQGEVVITKGSGNSYIITAVALSMDGTEYIISFSGELEEVTGDEPQQVSVNSLGRAKPRHLRATARPNVERIAKPTSRKLFDRNIAK